MIHVCFSLYDKTGRYSKFTGTTMLSIFENTTAPVTVHIFHDNTLTEDNRDKFIYMAGRYGQAVKFYNVETLCPDKLAKIMTLTPEAKNARVGVGAFYRLLIPQIFLPEIDKCIYLDSDIVVNLDIKEFWQIELGDKILAAVQEILTYETADGMNICFKLCKDGIVRHEDYFNSGVLLMNLNLLRGEEQTIFDGLRFRAQNHYTDYFDQNVLNYCFSTRYFKLPAKFNRPSQMVRLKRESVTKKIYHYSAGNVGVGIGLDMSDELNRLWMKYFVKTPWFNEEIIGRLYEAARVQSQKAKMSFFESINVKSRVFTLLEQDLKMIVETFSVKEYEEIILVKNGTPIQRIIDEINASRGEKIFFLLLPNFPFNVLEKAGFIRGRDFINAYDFLPKEFNSYPLVAAM